MPMAVLMLYLDDQYPIRSNPEQVEPKPPYCKLRLGILNTTANSVTQAFLLELSAIKDTDIFEVFFPVEVATLIAKH